MPRGKRTDLTRLRDKKLIEVFFRLTEIERLRTDDALTIMEQEVFFLDTKTIYALIFYNKTNYDYLMSLQGGKVVEIAIQARRKELTKQLKLGL